MTTQFVTWYASYCIPCCGTEAAPVKLCLDPDLILPTACPEVEGQEYAKNTIDATLVGCTNCSTSRCSTPRYQYVFSYDDAQLEEGITLNTDSILGVFCESCLTDWVENIVGAEPYIIDNGDDTYTFVSPHGCEYTITAGGGGEPFITAISDTATVDLDVTAATLTANVKISANGGNALTAEADGLYVAAGAGGGWGLTGDAGTVLGTNFIGTTDNVGHDVRVNNQRVRRSMPDAEAPIIIDGASTNAVTGTGSTIGGGGTSSEWGFYNHEITNGYYSTIAGGSGNQINDDDVDFSYGGGSFVGGGFENVVNNVKQAGDNNGVGFHVIGGGQSNVINEAGGNATIGGGFINLIDYSGMTGADADDPFCDTVAGGNINMIFGPFGDFDGTLGNNTICGGETNEIDVGISVFIGGGSDNIVQFGTGYVGDDAATNSFISIVGGLDNLVNDGTREIIGGGGSNTVMGEDSSGIFSGYGNRIQATSAVPYQTYLNYVGPPTTVGVGNAILGGLANRIVDGRGSSILGGAYLQIGDYTVAYQNPSTRTFPASGTYSLGAPQVDISAFAGIAYFGDTDLWIANTNNTARKLVLVEPNSDTDFSSAHSTTLEAQAQAANINYVMPATAGSPGDALRIQSVVGTTVTLHWAP